MAVFSKNLKEYSMMGTGHVNRRPNISMKCISCVIFHKLYRNILGQHFIAKYILIKSIVIEPHAIQYI